MTYNAGESLAAQEARHRRSDGTCESKQKQIKKHFDSVDVGDVLGIGLQA